MFSIIWMAACAGACAFGIGQLNPEAPVYASACIGVGIGWVFATLTSINEKLRK